MTNSRTDAGRHNNATLNPARMSDNVMFFTGQARLISPGSSPALRCSACTDPRLPRRAQPPHGTERASIFPPARIRFSSAVFFPLLSFSRQETNERSSSGPRAPAPLTRAPHPSRTRVWRDNATAAEKSHHHTPEIKVLDWFQGEPLHNSCLDYKMIFRLGKHAKNCSNGARFFFYSHDVFINLIASIIWSRVFDFMDYNSWICTNVCQNGFNSVQTSSRTRTNVALWLAEWTERVNSSAFSCRSFDHSNSWIYNARSCHRLNNNPRCRSYGYFHHGYHSNWITAA